MNSSAINAGIVLSNWCLPLTAIRPKNAPSAAKRIPAGSCPPFPVVRVVQAAASHQVVRIHTPAGSPEHPDLQPCAASDSPV